MYYRTSLHLLLYLIHGKFGYLRIHVYTQTLCMYVYVCCVYMCVEVWKCGSVYNNMCICDV
jgi:hypothetical protein